MSKTLFIGCSHSMGYKHYSLDTPAQVWQENNYAEIYSQINDKETIVMASAGCGNRAYPNFLAHALRHYDDIDEVFVQSTYWGRFPIAINPDLDEQEIFPLDFFIEKDFSSDLVKRYQLGLVQKEKYLEQYLKVEQSDWDDFKYMQDTTITRQPDIRRSAYLYVKMWHYNQTHLEQQDYMKDITFMDMLCRERNIPLHVWNINDRCFIPNNVDGYYMDLTQTTFAKQDALTYLQMFSDKILDQEKIDPEHYNYYIHDLIAKDYIPYLKEQK